MLSTGLPGRGEETSLTRKTISYENLFRAPAGACLIIVSSPCYDTVVRVLTSTVFYRHHLPGSLAT